MMVSMQVIVHLGRGLYAAVLGLGLQGYSHPMAGDRAGYGLQVYLGLGFCCIHGGGYIPCLAPGVLRIRLLRGALQ